MDDILYSLTTEQVNDKSLNIDVLPVKDILIIMNDEDKKVAYAVEEQLDNIELAINAIVKRMEKGGRLLYFGAGTSGRLGVLDAAECPPTFGVSPELIQGIMAGGNDAFTTAKEDIENYPEIGIEDVGKKDVKPIDAVIGLSASGRTPYVIGVLSEARRRGALTISLSCNKESIMDSVAEININVVVGPEVIMGSTRLKAGTAQKMVLNMISTTAMIKLGKVYKNLMVDVKPKNSKLKERAKRIVKLATGSDDEMIDSILAETGYDVKLTILMLVAGLSKSEARKLLDESQGYIAKAIEMSQRR